MYQDDRSRPTSFGLSYIEMPMCWRHSSTKTILILLDRKRVKKVMTLTMSASSFGFLRVKQPCDLLLEWEAIDSQLERLECDPVGAQGVELLEERANWLHAQL